MFDRRRRGLSFRRGQLVLMRRGLLFVAGLSSWEHAPAFRSWASSLTCVSMGRDMVKEVDDKFDSLLQMQ